MRSGAASSGPDPATMLVVGSDTAAGAALTTSVNAASADVCATHALSLPAALATLAEGTFDCVLLDVEVPDVAAVEVARVLRARAGSASLVAVAHVEGPATAVLAEVADLVLTARDLAGDWLHAVRRTMEHTHLRAALHAAETSVARLSSIVDSVGDAVFTTDVDGLVTTWNGGAEVLFGYSAADMVGQHAGLLHPPGSANAGRVLEMVRAGGSVRALEIVLRTRDGQLAEVSVDVSPLYGVTGEVTGTVVVGRDVGDRRELEAELVRQTMHDALTGLPNRAFLTYRLAQALVAARRQGGPVAVLVIDLDQFKAVGDVHGHLVGDRVLVEVADRLRSAAGPTDVVARLGGDEFALVCPDTDVQAAGRMAERVIAAVGRPMQVEHRALRIGASVGIAVSPPLDDDAETLLKHADAAVYEAKARGRARSQVFDHQFAREAADRRLLAVDLQHAIDSDQLQVHYQPVLDLATDRILGVEALARWRHPLRGAVPPSTFVPLAEAHGFMADLDRWVLDRACHEIVAALRSGDLPPAVRVAINLSARSLDDPGLLATVDAAIRRSGLPPDSLVLEVTETAVLQNREAARTSLAGLRTLGAGVFLDDFGTGYSSLSFLRELPVTGVKIDQSFVRGAVDRPEDLAITEAIVRLSHGLGLETVGEGVETVEQRDLLRNLGCASAQGYWWSAAVPVAELAGGRAAARVARLHEAPPAELQTARRWTPLRRRQPAERPAAGPHRTACCLRGGFESGQAWLVVTAPERRELFARSLGPLHAEAVARGQLVELDAYDTLRKVTGADGRLDAARFEHVVGSALRRLWAAGTEVGVHAELGHVTQPLPSLLVSTDLRRQLHGVTGLGLAYGDHPADCAVHGPLPLGQLAVDDSTAS